MAAELTRLDSTRLDLTAPVVRNETKLAVNIIQTKLW
jgi:hypothetical protein